MSADVRFAARRFCSSDFVDGGQQLQSFHSEFECTSCSSDKSMHMWLDWAIQRCEEGNPYQQYELHSEAHQEAQVLQVTTEVMLVQPLRVVSSTCRQREMVDGAQAHTSCMLQSLWFSPELKRGDLASAVGERPPLPLESSWSSL